MWYQVSANLKEQTQYNNPYIDLLTYIFLFLILKTDRANG